MAKRPGAQHDQGQQDDDLKRWHDFGVWLEGRMLERYPSWLEFARAVGLAPNSVKALLKGGWPRSDGTMRVSNPTDATLRKIALVLHIPDKEMFERAGGTFRERNPERWKTGPWASGRRAEAEAEETDRLTQVEEEIRTIRQRNEELEAHQRLIEQTLRDAGIPIPGDAGSAGSGRPRHRRTPG